MVGRRSEQLPTDQFLADELSLQVLHGPGDPRVSQVETLSRYVRIDADRIEAQQWQVSYDSPAAGLIAEAKRHWGGMLVLERQPVTRSCGMACCRRPPHPRCAPSSVPCPAGC